MAGATAAVSKETLTLSANTTTTQYSSSTTNNAFYALDEFVTNLPYKVGTRNTSGLCCYFIVNPSKSYTFSTSYKYGDSDTYRQWNNFTVSSSSNAIASSKYKEITTSVPKFKNLGRLYSYTGACQTYTPILAGYKYQMECWGAAGGQGSVTNNGHGAYVGGTIILGSDDMYVYVGQKGVATENTGAWNGGGKKGTEGGDGSGGGATDIRTTMHTDENGWGGLSSLCSRILVAAGGGGSDDYEAAQQSYYGGGPAIGGIYASGGGIESPSATITNNWIKVGATQTSAGSCQDLRSSYTGTSVGGFGHGNITADVNNRRNLAGGGSGYWGSGGSDGGGMGGSSFISGHAGCVALTNGNATDDEHLTFRDDDNAVEKSKHYTGYYFLAGTTKMIDGGGKSWTTTQGSYEAMPSPTAAASYYTIGNGTAAAGNTGNGYARITCMPYD